MLPSTLAGEERVSTRCMLPVAETVPRGDTGLESYYRPGHVPELNMEQRRRCLFFEPALRY